MTESEVHAEMQLANIIGDHNRSIAQTNIDLETSYDDSKINKSSRPLSKYDMSHS